MNIIFNFLIVLGLILFFLMIAGLIKPKWILMCTEQKTRRRILSVLGVLCLSLAAAASATEPLINRTAKAEGGPVVRGQISPPIQSESLEVTNISLKCSGGRNRIHNNGGSEGALIEFLQKNGFKKEKSLYIHLPDASHPLKPYLALSYKYGSKGLRFFELDNWYSDPVAAATIPTDIHIKLELMEASLLSELLGPTLGNTLSSIRRELKTSEEGEVFSLTLNGRDLYGFITSGGGSVVFMDDETPLGTGKYRKTPKRVAGSI